MGVAALFNSWSFVLRLGRCLFAVPDICLLNHPYGHLLKKAINNIPCKHWINHFYKFRFRFFPGQHAGGIQISPKEPHKDQDQSAGGCAQNVRRKKAKLFKTMSWLTSRFLKFRISFLLCQKNEM